MPKLKTHSGAAKRFHKTGTGKFKRGQSKMRHILTSKATKTKRHLGGRFWSRRRISQRSPGCFPTPDFQAGKCEFFKSSRFQQSKGPVKAFRPLESAIADPPRLEVA